MPTGLRVGSIRINPQRTHTVVTAATAAPVATPENPAPMDQIWRTPEPVPTKSSIGADVVTLVTTVQQIVIALNAAQTGDERFAVVVKAAYGLKKRNKDQTSLFMQYTLHQLIGLIILLLLKEDQKWRETVNICCTSKCDQESRRDSTPEGSWSAESRP